MSEKIYTPELLRAMAEAGPSDTCAFPGCNEPRYISTRKNGRNPYHCCIKHKRKIIHMEWRNHADYLAELDHLGFRKEAKLLSGAKNKLPRVVDLFCDLCKLPFFRLKSKVHGDHLFIFCPDCWENRCFECMRIARPAERIVLQCSLCKTSFEREKYQNRENQKKRGKDCFCPDCWENRCSECRRIVKCRDIVSPGGRIILQCSLCKTSFERLTSDHEYRQKRGYKNNYFCPGCWANRKSECARLARPIEKIILQCSLCKTSFERIIRFHKQHIRKGLTKNFCPNCWANKYSECRRIAWPPEKIILQCSLCKTSFEKSKNRYQYSKRRRSRNIFCLDCWVNRKSECMRLTKC